MKILGLTGDIACGKSSVARLLGEYGAAQLDSDLLVRQLYADAAFASRIQSLFSSEVSDLDGAVDRAKLAALVFADKAKLRALEKLVHPSVALLRARRLRELELAGQKVVTIEAVKLLESGQGAICDEIWCVVCAPDVQLRRLMHDRDLSEVEAQQRLQNQPTRAQKSALARDVPLLWLENNGSMDDLRALVARHWTRFLA